MNYIPKPTLEHIARVKVAATLWNQEDVKDLLSKFQIPLNYTDIKSEWVEIEAIALKKVAKLPLPEQVKEEILCIIRPVGFEIVKWRDFHDSYNLRIVLPTEFFWTPQGTIDRKKTAELMIEDEDIDITTRYKLACIYCLEEDIPKLWEKIHEDCRESFYSQEDQKELVIFWTCQINGEVEKMDSIIFKKMGRRFSPYQYAFERVVFDNNKVATEYFLQKLTTAEREESLIKSTILLVFIRFDPICICEPNGFQVGTYSDVLCFLLSQLSISQQLKVFKIEPLGVLSCLLNWPWQNFFMETANHMWTFLPERIYESVFIHFTGSIIGGYKDFNYRKLFQEFWEQSPHNYRRYVLSNGIISRIVSELLQIRDKDNIKLLFQDATPADKKSIIYDVSEDTCKKLLNDNQLSLLKYFIKECLPSKDEVIKFKKHFKNGGIWQVNEYQLRNWKPKFLYVLDDIIFELEKENE